MEVLVNASAHITASYIRKDRIKTTWSLHLHFSKMLGIILGNHEISFTALSQAFEIQLDRVYHSEVFKQHVNILLLALVYPQARFDGVNGFTSRLQCICN